MEHTLASVLWRIGGVLALVLANGLSWPRSLDRDGAQDAHRPVDRRRTPRARAVRRCITEPESYIAATQFSHHDGQPRPRLDQRAGAGHAGPAGDSHSMPAMIAETTAHSVSVASRSS